MRSKIRIEASMSLELDRRQIEILSHLLSYGSGLAKMIVSTVTGQIREDDLRALFVDIQMQVEPAVKAIEDAERALATQGIER